MIFAVCRETDFVCTTLTVVWR